MKAIAVSLPLTRKAIATLRAGDNVLLTGILYTGRDAAHKKLTELLLEDKPLPIDIKGQTLYYVGPAPTKEGHAIGSAGPTSSYRMDKYTPQLLDAGLIGMIGKGKISLEVIESIKKHGAVYFGAAGGAAALIAQSVVKSSVVAYEDLGPEAIHRFEVNDFPVIVLIDSQCH